MKFLKDIAFGAGVLIVGLTAITAISLISLERGGRQAARQLDGLEDFVLDAAREITFMGSYPTNSTYTNQQQIQNKVPESVNYQK